MSLTVTRTYTLAEVPPVAPEVRYLIAVTDAATGLVCHKAYAPTRVDAVQQLKDAGYTVAGT